MMITVRSTALTLCTFCAIVGCSQESTKAHTTASSTTAVHTATVADTATSHALPEPIAPPTSAVPLERLTSVHDTMSCDFGALTDYDDPRPIPISDVPNGPPTHVIKHDSTSDAWQLDVRAYADGYFYARPATLEEAVPAGWIPSEFVRMYARNYNRPLVLHTAPSETSPAASTLKEWWNGFYIVTHCSGGKWLEVKATIDGVSYKGWMSPKDQCDNPYTSCS